MGIESKLFKARKDITFGLHDLFVEYRYYSGIVLPSPDNISISIIYSALAARWIEVRHFDRIECLFSKRDMSLTNYVHQYIPQPIWGNREYGLGLMHGLNSVFMDFDNQEYRNKVFGLLKRVLQPILADKDFTVYDETLFTFFREKINAFKFDVNTRRFIVDDRVQKYESYYTPKDLSNFIVDQGWERSSKRYDMHVLDPTCGSGNLLITYLQKVRRECGEEAMFYAARNCIYGVDFDQRALSTLALTLFVMAYDPKQELPPLGSRLMHTNIFLVQKDYFIRRRDKITIDSLNLDLILMNPPYKSYKNEAERKSSFQGRRAAEEQRVYEETLKLHTYIIDYMFKFIKPNGSMSMVVPSNVIKYTKNLKRFIGGLFRDTGNLSIFNFDIIPASLFNQRQWVEVEGASKSMGKSISQRSTVISYSISRDEPVVSSTRLLRWKSKERPILFKRIPSTRVDYRIIQNIGFIPNISDPKGNKLLLELLKSKKLGNYNSRRRPDDFVLDIINGARYFIYASFGPKSPKRCTVNTKRIKAVSATEQYFLYIYLNSNVFYWLWRTFTVGHLVQSDFLKELPVPDVPDSKKKEMIDLAKKLQSKEQKCTFSYIAGRRNVNFNKDLKMLEELDRFVLGLLGLKYSDYREMLLQSKSNSLTEISIPVASDSDEDQ